ncbi:hypothetical protein D1007_22405 [Hordeum vulgare]|nr:hypothetical protein D1007_22405 [Hordeum vulgare]
MAEVAVASTGIAAPRHCPVRRWEEEEREGGQREHQWGHLAPKKGQYRDAWVGSDICDNTIEALRDHRMLPLASLVAVRVPGAEAAPTPEKCEVVVFEEHFYHGSGLPASDFFARFLTFFGLEPHHLAPKAIARFL